MVLEEMEVKPSWLVLLFHMTVGRHSVPVRSSNLVQGSLVLGDMLDRKVDTDFSSLYPEFSSKNRADLSMEVNKPVKLWPSRVVTWDKD